MELDRDLYQKTFSHLKASPELGRAVVEMEEKRRKPKRFLMRRALVAAAVLALAFALALGANAATGGGLFGPLQSVAMFFADGEQVALDCTRDADGKLRIVSSRREGADEMEGRAVIVFLDEATGELLHGVWEDGSATLS